MAKWRRLAALLAAAVMMALSLCGCNVVLLLGNLEETSSPATFTSDDGRYSLTATAVWEKDPDSANALFIQRTDAREGYVTVIRDAKAELESGLTLEEYAEFYTQTLGDTREDTSVVRGALKERPAYTFDQRGSVNNIRWRTGVLPGDGRRFCGDDRLDARFRLGGTRTGAAAGAGEPDHK